MLARHRLSLLHYIPTLEEGAKAAADAISDAMTADFMVTAIIVECIDFQQTVGREEEKDKHNSLFSTIPVSIAWRVEG